MYGQVWKPWVYAPVLTISLTLESVLLTQQMWFHQILIPLVGNEVQASLVQFSFSEECLVYRAKVNPGLLCIFFFLSSSCPPPLSLVSLNVISLFLFSQFSQGSLLSRLSLMPHPGNRGIFSCHCPAHTYSSLATVSLTPSPSLEGEDTPPLLLPCALNPFYSCLPKDLLHYQLPF